MQLVNPFIYGASTKSWEFIASTSSKNSTSLTLPASIDAGDLLIVFNLAMNMSTTFPTLVTPSGFTNKVNETFSRLSYDQRNAISVKKATGSEDGASVSVMNSNDFAHSALCLQFRPVNFTISSVGNLTLGNREVREYEGNPASITSLNTGIKLPSLTLGQIGTFYKDSPIPFSAQSPTFDGTVSVPSGGNSFQQTVGYRVQEETVTNQTIDMSDHGQNNYMTVFHLYDNGL